MSDANVRIIIQNRGDEATITASPVFETLLPVENIQNPLKGYFARTTGLSTQEIYLDWGGATHILTAINLSQINLGATSTIRLRIWEGQNQTGNIVYDSGDVLAIKPKTLGDLNWGVDPLGATMFTNWTGEPFTTIWFSQVYGQSAQITIQDPLNTDGFIQLGRLFLGYHFEPQYNMSYGLNYVNDNTHVSTRTEGGSLRTDLGTTFRKISFSLNEIRNEQRAVFFNQVQQIADNATDFFISCFPEQNNEHERNYSMVAKTANKIGITNNYFGNYTSNWDVEET